MLENMAYVSDPHQYLERMHEFIRMYPLTVEEKAARYERYIHLVTPLPKYLQDQLLTAGAPIFNYRLSTAREDIKRVRAAQGDVDQTKVQCMVDSPELMAEAIYLPDSPPPKIRYAVFNKTTGAVEIKEGVSLSNGILYMPPQSHLAEKGVVGFATGIEEYGTQRDLFYALRNFLQSYVQIDDPVVRVLAICYIFLTWMYDRSEVVPYLRFLGDWGSGKSRALQVVGAISYRAIAAGGALTASPIFRLIERYKGTMVIDEADFTESEMWGEITKILNVGYMKGFPILRSERTENDFDVGTFDCYGPKVLGTRRRFQDQALESRCFTHTMVALGSIRAGIPFILDQQFRDEAAVLRRKLLLWRLRSFSSTTVNVRQQIPGLDPRLNQIVLPLLSVADGAALRDMIVRLAHTYQRQLQESRRETVEGMIAMVLIKKFRASGMPPTEVLLKEIPRWVHEEFGDGVRLSTRTAGSIARDVLKLDTYGKGGQTWLKIPANEMLGLERRYHMLPTVELTLPESSAPSLALGAVPPSLASGTGPVAET